MSNGRYLCLENLHKRFGEKEILRGVDLEIIRGETMVIIGQSGTGKSVTLKHIVGLLKPDQGKVQFDGQCIHELNKTGLEEVRKRFGYLFQDGALLKSMDVYENVALPLREHTRMGESEIHARVEKVLDMVGLKDAIRKMPSDLSGGMRKRVGLARAIVREPEIIMYDEPTSGLDPVNSSIIDELIMYLQQQLGTTSIVVTHDMKSARTICDRIALLHRGKVRYVGTKREFIHTDDELVRQFVKGEPEGPLSADTTIRRRKKDSE
jgi:phospholipid/cholesterol/gamma-HCH transport system ATP-binding protein